MRQDFCLYLTMKKQTDITSKKTNKQYQCFKHLCVSLCSASQFLWSLACSTCSLKCGGFDHTLYRLFTPNLHLKSQLNVTTYSQKKKPLHLSLLFLSFGLLLYVSFRWADTSETVSYILIFVNLIGWLSYAGIMSFYCIPVSFFLLREVVLLWDLLLFRTSHPNT